MSKGPGQVERRIAELFAATRDRALSVAEIADHAFELGRRPATRAQRLSATRAAHRLIRRIKEAAEKHRQLIDEAHREAKAAVGYSHGDGHLPRRPSHEQHDRWLEKYRVYEEALKATEPSLRAEKVYAFVQQFGSWMRIIHVDKHTMRGEHEYWRATTTKGGVLYFHPPDVPVRVWAVSIQAAGVIWAEAEVCRITESKVTVRYAGELGH
jgi:hypothetical protein